MSFEPGSVFLTHYSQVTGLPRLASDMHACLDEFVALAENLKDAGDARHDKMKQKMHTYLVKRVREHGCTLDQKTVDTWLEMDVELNAKGLAVWLDRKSR